MDSEKEAGGGGSHAILKVVQFFVRRPHGQKVDFPLHRSEADASVRILGPTITGTIPISLCRIDSQLSMAFRRGSEHVDATPSSSPVRRSSQVCQLCESRLLLLRPLTISWRLSGYMMSKQISSKCRSPVQGSIILSEGYRKWILVTQRNQLAGYGCSGQL